MIELIEYILLSEDKPLPAKAILKTFAKDKEDRKTIEKALDQVRKDSEINGLHIDSSPETYTFTASYS